MPVFLFKLCQYLKGPAFSLKAEGTGASQFSVVMSPLVTVDIVAHMGLDVCSNFDIDILRHLRKCQYS